MAWFNRALSVLGSSGAVPALLLATAIHGTALADAPGGSDGEHARPAAGLARAVDRGLPDERIDLTLYADLDDDDDDGIPDAARLAKSREDLRWIRGARTLRAIEGDVLRVVADGKPVERVGAPLNVRALGLTGLKAGRARLVLADAVVDVSVVALVAVDNAGPVDRVRSHASLTRVLPAGLSGSESKDADALRWVVVGPPEALPAALSFASTRPNGVPLDSLVDIPVAPSACPEPVPAGLKCMSTPPIRATTDEVDRDHPAARARSLRAEVGGRIAVTAAGHKVASIRVGGPRRTDLGPIGRFRAKLRVRIVRATPGGPLPVGPDARTAISVVRSELEAAGALWGQCGVHFGTELDIDVVDPPPAHLVAVGCDSGLPASGGRLTLRVGAARVTLETKPGQTPTQVAIALASRVVEAGYRATVSANARTGPAALRTADVLVRRPDGSLATISPEPKARISEDPTLDVCIGAVDLTDGLTHFTDYDAAAGTIEERSLLKALDDGDPATIEVLVIPSFARTGRIGESFIHGDGSSVRNAVIIDRTAIQARTRSFALAHELGHILLDIPGHPDDYGVDSGSRLMDADAADESIFGPRRLSIAECERALRQSGPRAPVPLLVEWPLFGGTSQQAKAR